MERAQAARAFLFRSAGKGSKRVRFARHFGSGKIETREKLFGEPSQTRRFTSSQTYGKVRFAPAVRGRGKNPLTSHVERFCGRCREPRQRQWPTACLFRFGFRTVLQCPVEHLFEIVKAFRTDPIGFVGRAIASCRSSSYSLKVAQQKLQWSWSHVGLGLRYTAFFNGTCKVFRLVCNPPVVFFDHCSTPPFCNNSSKIFFS